MSNINTERIINIDSIYYNNIENKQYLFDILLKQKNDPIVKAIGNPKKRIDLETEVEILDNTQKSLWIFCLDDIFKHLKNNYPFIVTVPEQYKDTIVDQGNMIPVNPSDEKYWRLHGFKGTIWINPFLENQERRYIVEIINKQKLFPFLAWPEEHTFFGWVWVLPMNFWDRLKIWQDYKIVWLYSGKELDKELEQYKNNKIKEVKEKYKNTIVVITPKKAIW